MNEIRSSRLRDQDPRRTAEEALASDLASLRSASARDLPPLNAVTREIVASRPAHDSGGILMRMILLPRRCPILVLSSVAALALALFVVPVPYEHVVGHEVTVTLADPGPQRLKAIADALHKTLGAEEVRVSISDGGSGSNVPEAALTLDVPEKSRSKVEGKMAAVAQVLADNGVAARTRVTTHKERVFGNVVAYANEVLTINIHREGRTGEEIAAEIRSQLEAAGFSDPEVEVTNTPDEFTVSVMKRREGEGGAPSEPLPELRINVDGQQPQGHQVEIRVERQPGMTDADCIAQVERQLAAQGVQADVTMENGRIRIHRRQ